LAIFFRFGGLFVSVYSIIYAVQGNSNGHQHGKLAIAIAVGTLAIVGILFALKVTVMHSPY
jgi:hypothetical protein